MPLRRLSLWTAMPPSDSGFDETPLPEARPASVPGYTVVRLIGTGGFSLVYEAIQEVVDAPVALKVLTSLDATDTRSRERFLRECKTMGQLRGTPGIAWINQATFTSDGRPVIVMAYYPNGTVADRIVRDGPLPIDEALDIGIRVAGALDSAHARGISHRDLKPENLLIGDDGSVALADFGIAIVDGQSANTQTLGAMSPSHAPPERVEPDLGPEDPFRSDVYSLASTIYTMLAGHTPFDDGGRVSGYSLMSRILNAPLPPLIRDDVPTGLMPVLERAMAKRSEDRYPSAADFADALATIRSGGAIGSWTATPRAPSNPLGVSTTDPFASGNAPWSTTADGPASSPSPSASTDMWWDESVDDEPEVTDPGRPTWLTDAARSGSTDPSPSPSPASSPAPAPPEMPPAAPTVKLPYTTDAPRSSDPPPVAPSPKPPAERRYLANNPTVIRPPKGMPPVGPGSAATVAGPSITGPGGAIPGGPPVGAALHGGAPVGGAPYLDADPPDTGATRSRTLVTAVGVVLLVVLLAVGGYLVVRLREDPVCEPGRARSAACSDDTAESGGSGDADDRTPDRGPEPSEIEPPSITSVGMDGDAILVRWEDTDDLPGAPRVYEVSWAGGYKAVSVPIPTDTPGEFRITEVVVEGHEEDRPVDIVGTGSYCVKLLLVEDDGEQIVRHARAEKCVGDDAPA